MRRNILELSPEDSDALLIGLTFLAAGIRDKAGRSLTEEQLQVIDGIKARLVDSMLSHGLRLLGRDAA
jgi:hypothetical protein